MGLGNSKFIQQYEFLYFDKGPVSTLDDNLPPFPRITCRRHPPDASVGLLDHLPTELLHQTITQLDIRSLINFRLSNRRTAELVDSLPQFRAISTHAQNALRGILAIDTGRWITCATLYEKLCTSKCDFCGAHGGYLYLITCKRACFRCLSTHRSCHPLPLDTAAFTFTLDRSILCTLPRMTAIPGTYSPNETIRERIVLVDFDSAVAAGLEVRGIHGGATRKEACVRGQFLAAVWGIFRGYVTHDADTATFAAVSRVPWFNKKTTKFEDLSFCDACLQHPRDSEGAPRSTWRLQYTKMSLVDHGKTCQFRRLER
ncbi:hypothetical protein ACHAPT_007635 [Fusarium lateritium]